MQFARQRPQSHIGVLRLCFQLLVVGESLVVIAVGDGFQCRFFRHLVEFVSTERLARLLGQCSIVVHASLVGVDVLQVGECCLRLFRVRIVLNHLLVGIDGSIGLLVLIVDHTDFVACLASVGTLRIFLYERSKTVHGLLFLTRLHVGTSLLEEGIRTIFRLTVLVAQLSEQFHLLRVVASESADECLLKQTVITVGAVGVECFLVGVEGCVVVAIRELAVANAVVGIGTERLLVAQTGKRRFAATHKLLEVRLCFVVFLLFKTGVAERVFCQSLVLHVARLHGEVVLQVGVRQRVVCQPVFRLALPVVGFCIVLRADALQHEVLSTLEVAVGESQHTQVVEHLLLCLYDFRAWIFDFIDGGEGSRIVFRSEIHFREVLAHLVLVL